MFPKSTSESPFNKLPYDLLREIFLQCLSEYPLYDPQPDTKIAPILLCHVCSSWRAVALTSASLWSHLYIRLPLLWDEPEEEEEEEEEKLMVRSRVALARDLEFLQWWRTNQGAMALFLHVDIHRMSWNDGISSPYTLLASEAEDFLVEYLSSAHYLDIGAFYPYLVKQHVNRGSPASFPNLRALVVLSHYARFGVEDDDEYEPFIETLPSHIPPALQRLTILNYIIPPNHSLRDWSALTHVSLDDVDMYLDTWFTLIRTLVDLEWGHFNVMCEFTDAIERTQPPKSILARLSTLSVAIDIQGDHEFSLSTVLQNLQFPALHTLSLLSSARTWSDSRALIEIHNLLKAAPAVKTLALRVYGSQRGFLCFENDSDLPTVIERNVEPLLKYAPNLSQLQVELRCPNESDVAILAKDYIKRFFLSKRWLDLANPMSKIRKVTIVIKRIPWDVDLEFMGILKALLKWNIRKYIKTETDVSFEIASEAEEGIYNFGRAWETWGSRPRA